MSSKVGTWWFGQLLCEVSSTSEVTMALTALYLMWEDWSAWRRLEARLFSSRCRWDVSLSRWAYSSEWLTGEAIFCPSADLW